MRAVLALALLVAAAGFAWLGLRPWTETAAPAPTTTPAAATETAAVRLALRDPAPVDLSRVATRPLFSAARRPPPPEAPGEPLAPEDPRLLFGVYEIAGVVTLGQSAMVMLRDEAGRLLRLRPGDRLPTPGGEAEVLEITLSTLTFSRAGEKVVADVEREGSGVE